MKYEHSRGSTLSTALICALSGSALLVVLALVFSASKNKHVDVPVEPPTKPPVAVVPAVTAKPEPKNVVVTPDPPPPIPVPPIPEPPPKPKDHFPLDLSSACNEFIGAKWKRENKDGDGIPADGRVQVSAVVPRAYFNFILPGEAPNAILTSGGPVTVLVPPALRGTFGRLAVMHGSQKGSVSVKATLVYTTGEAVVEDLRVQDWNKTGEAKETFVHKALKAGPVQLFSQNLKLDPTRQLSAVTFQSSESAVIFSATLIVSGDRPFKDGE